MSIVSQQRAKGFRARWVLSPLILLLFCVSVPRVLSASVTSQSTGQSLGPSKHATVPQENSPAQSPVGTPLIIKDIKFLEQGEKESVLIYVNRIFTPTVFSLEGERPRVVIDIPDADSIREGLRTIPVNGRFIKQVRTRHDKQSGTFRIVVDLDPRENYKVDQVFFEAESIYAIEVQREPSKEDKGAALDSREGRRDE